MPNWMSHALEISGPFEEVEKFFNTIGGGMSSEDNSLIDFELLIKPPDNLYRGNIGDAEREYCKKNNVPNWYDWNIKNWGTKWNAAYQKLHYSQDGKPVLLFETAWSVPFPILMKIEELVKDQFTNIEIYGEFLEEGYESGGTFLINKDGGAVRKVNTDYVIDKDKQEIHRSFQDDEGEDFDFKYL